MANEKVLVDNWFFQRLSGDSTLMAMVPGGVWSQHAPPPLQLATESAGGVPYPVVVFDMNKTVDRMNLSADRIMVDFTYLVKAIDAIGNQGTVQPIADRLDVLLHRVTDSFGGINILRCWRETIVAFAELDSGTDFRHLGGLYNLEAQTQ